MALEIALAVLGPAIDVAKWVSKPIIRQFNYLCCFSSNISSLEEEAKKLDDALKGLEGEVEIKRRNIEDPFPEVETWLTDSKKIQSEISGILNEATDAESGCSKIGARFSLSKRAKKKTESTKEHRDGKPSAQFLQRPNAATQGVQLGNTFECESRNEIEEDIMTALRGGDEKMIGICGMGGLGKTTMANKIMNRAVKENIFGEAVIVTFSEKVDISKIQEDIGAKLGLDKLKVETSQAARAQLLLSRLSDTKGTTLLVLDDVWETLELQDFGIPCNSKGCTILFTSRNRDDLRKMGVKILFGMKELSEEEAWSFFKERVGTCVDDRELNPIAKQVAKECGGLPINLAAVAAGLYDERDAGIWKDTLRKLEESVPDNVQYKKPLRWSYDRLNSDEAQFLFLLCCLFPEDADIPLDYLTYFCMGLCGMPKGIRNMEAATNNMRALTKFLKDRSLLLESDEEDCVRMHDVVRDVCTSIAEEKGYIGKHGCAWISSSHLLSGSRYPKLRLLFLYADDDSLRFKFDDAFVEVMRELNVLWIENHRSLTRLPHPTQSLGNLNTLILVACAELETISVVGELVNLEILICRDCYSIEELPSKMKILKSLKVLELTKCFKLQSIGRDIISSLVGLEELKMLDSFNRWEAEDRKKRKNASIKELEALRNLACLEIDIKDPSLLTENMPLLSKKIVRFRITTDGINPFPSKFSKAMSLWLERESRLGDWIEKQLLKDTECLYLSGDGANNVDLAKIQNIIRWLELFHCESMKNVARTSGGSDVFPSIEYLELISLLELQEICDGPISSTSFQNLKKLQLRDLRALTQFWKSSSLCQNIYVPHFPKLSSILIYECDSLRNLGQLSMASGKDCLPHLQQLTIINCSMMEQVFLWNDDEQAGQNKTSILITKVFPRLKDVELLCLPNLRTFYQGIQGIEFPLLTQLQIRGCPKMKSIIGSSSADNDDDGSLHFFCQPQKISFGSSFKVLEMDHNPFCGHEMSPSLFNGLEELTIYNCEGSMSLFTLSVAANLVSLIKLFVQDCGEMIKVIEDEQQQQRILVFPKLKILDLENLPELVSFCDSKCEVEWPLLKNVRIKRCQNMKNFSLRLVAAPNVEAFITDLTTYVGVGVDVAFNSLKKLEITDNVNPFVDRKISVSLFNGLEKLEFSEYNGGSMSLFSSSAVGNLGNLRVLQISDFDEMLVNVIEDDGKVVSGGVVFPKLEELRLWRLPKLVRLCEWKCDVQLPSLTEVVIMDCPNMESLSMGFVAAPNLKIVKIDRKEIEATEDLNGALQQHYLVNQKEEKEEEEEEEEEEGSEEENEIDEEEEEEEEEEDSEEENEIDEEEEEDQN